jgi:ribosome-associated toxin RatA of RatAB toxin-antitoxin module
MAKAEINETLEVPFEKLFATVTRYEDYPQFVDGCTEVKVERKGPGKARVTYHVSMIKDVIYTLDHVEDEAAGVISWTLVESNAMKVNNGRWTLKREGDAETSVHYQVEIEFNFPVPGMILNRLIKSSLPSMLRNFEEQAGGDRG